MKGRDVPPLDQRRIRACLKACEHISTDQLETGLVHDVFESHAMLQVAIGLASQVAAQGKNPADYIDLARTVEQSALISARMEASGYSEAMNRAYERRTGRSLDTPERGALLPLRTPRR